MIEDFAFVAIWCLGVPARSTSFRERSLCALHSANVRKFPTKKAKLAVKWGIFKPKKSTFLGISLLNCQKCPFSGEILRYLTQKNKKNSPPNNQIRCFSGNFSRSGN